MNAAAAGWRLTLTGDLPEFGLIEAYDDKTIRESWRLIQSYDVTTIYPAHGNSYSIG